MCSLAVSGDGEEAASHRDEALKLQSDEKKVQGQNERRLVLPASERGKFILTC